MRMRARVWARARARVKVVGHEGVVKWGLVFVDCGTRRLMEHEWSSPSFCRPPCVQVKDDVAKKALHKAHGKKGR
jgi:hypothetical protein